MQDALFADAARRTRRQRENSGRGSRNLDFDLDLFDMPAGLNADQQAAAAACFRTFDRGGRFLCKGPPGTGKTFWTTAMVDAFRKRGLSVAYTAGTHKAVSVGVRNLRRAGFGDEVPGLTMQSLLQLKAKPDADRLVFERPKWATPVEADVVIHDETGMAGVDLAGMMRRHLPRSYCIHVGDPSQLSPVGERQSCTFDIKHFAELTIPQRTAADNPILGVVAILLQAQHSFDAAEEAAREARSDVAKQLDLPVEAKDWRMDWSWVKPNNDGKAGIFVPRDRQAWLKKAFTSPEFEEDPDYFRYVCWRNNRVEEVNAQVRRWRYGETKYPLEIGERATFRNSVIIDELPIWATNEEARVLEIAPDVYTHSFSAVGDNEAWVARLGTYRVRLKRDDGSEADAQMIADAETYIAILDRLKEEARRDGRENRERWKDYHKFRQAVADLRPIYATTCHNAQGSTFTYSFLDVGDMRLRFRSDPYEALRLYMTGLTRPTTGCILTGVS